MGFLNGHIDQIRLICKLHHVERLYAFGSVVTDRFNTETSDIDLLVEMKDLSPVERGESLLLLWEAFELLFDRKVDLLSNTDIQNPFLKKEIEAGKRLLYDGSREKISF